MLELGAYSNVVNNTTLTVEEILALPFIGNYRNNWRQRTVALYRLAPGVVISVGIFDDRKTVVICQESDEQHAPALEAFRQGRSYIYR